MLAALSRTWYRPGHPVGKLLAPLGLAWAGAARLRRSLYEQGVLAAGRAGVPVVVVGNLTVGGTGKTPLVLWLVERLSRAGWRPGIATRGHGGRAVGELRRLRHDDDPRDVGDEPLMLLRRSGAPVVAAPRRLRAARCLAEECGCDVVVCDDGLQHLALHRDVEIAVIDGVRRLGNGRCLPAGPLREPAARLEQVDFRVVNGGEPRGDEVPMTLVPGALTPLAGEGVPQPLSALAGERVHAVAGIGNPERFFAMLEQAGLVVERHAFADHHAFVAEDLRFAGAGRVLMTEKDAVKCSGFAPPGAMFLPVTASLPESFGQRVLHLIGERPHGPKAA